MSTRRPAVILALLQLVLGLAVAAMARAAAAAPPGDAGDANAAGGAVPALVVEAPARYEGLARRLRELDPGRLATVARLTGTDRPGPPIRVLLAPEGSGLAAAVPPWVAGYADGASGTVVLLPARTPTYPDSSLEDLLRHEVAHVLVTRAAGGRPLPRWFHEGVATIAGTSWFADRSYLAAALLSGEETPLPELDRRFTGGEGEARRAYAVAGAFVRDLIQNEGPEVVGRILSGVGAGWSFEEAFARATGTSLAAAGAAFWRRQTFWYRWVPLLTSSVTLWMGITLLALYAIRRRRARDAALRLRWEEEEEAAAERRRRMDEEGGEEGWGPS